MPVDTVIRGGTIVTADDTIEASVAVDNGEVVGDPGHGEFVPREIPNWSL